jgi:UDP-glucose-4-epimerase GalE
MDSFYLHELIEETNARGGGLILNFQDKPAVVVLGIDKYNSLLEGKDAFAPNSAVEPDQPTQISPKPAKARQKSRKVLVTGGAGYIGAHLVRQLLQAGYEVTVLDNLSSGKRENVPAKAAFMEGDLADLNLLRDVFASADFEAVFHLAASLEVEESVREPQKYFDNNVGNIVKLLSAMNEAGVKKIIFSSSAAVYGEQQVVPISEKAPLRPNNPYGATKLLGEKIIKFYCDYMGFKGIVFRYFNACGCDFDGQIAATHESHLIPIVLGVAAGLKPQIRVNGDDYETSDGSCVRDYVHVLDIARVHVLALERMDAGDNLRVFNIGTGRGSSVKEIIACAAEVLNRIIPMEIGPRREGDAPATVADNSKLAKEFGFLPEHSDLETIITTSWRQLNNHR